MKRYRVTGATLAALALIVIFLGCFNPLNDSHQSLQIQLRSASGPVSAQSLTGGDDGYLFVMVISEEVLLDGGESATALLADTQAALVDAQESIARGTTPEEFEINLALEAGEFQSLVVNLAESPSGSTQFTDLASGVPYFVVVHVIGSRETLIGTGRATLEAGETTTVPITLSNDLAAFESEVSTRYGGTIDLSLEYTVSFDTRGGTEVDSVVLNRGQDLGDALDEISGDLTRGADGFLGWKLGDLEGAEVSATTDSAVVEDVSLVASWTATIEVSGLDAVLDSLPLSEFFDGNTSYDLIDAEEYVNPALGFGEQDPESEFVNFGPSDVDTWYNQGEVTLINESAATIMKTGLRAPLEDLDEDGTYTITGIAPGKSWRLLITTWNDRENVTAAEGALFSSSFESEDGQTIQFVAGDLESASWDS